MSTVPPSVPQTAHSIHALHDQCVHVHKKQKTQLHDLQQRVDNLIDRVHRFQQQIVSADNNNNDNNNNVGALFLGEQLPSFANELKTLIRTVSQSHKEYHQTEVQETLQRSVEHSIPHHEQNQESFYQQYAQSRGFHAMRDDDHDHHSSYHSSSSGSTKNNNSGLFDEHVLKLAVMQHLIREGHFQVVDILEEEMARQQQQTSSSLPCHVSDSYKQVFKEMYHILDDMKRRKRIDGALNWCRQRATHLNNNATAAAVAAAAAGGDGDGGLVASGGNFGAKLARIQTLEFMLHRVHFIELLREGCKGGAVVGAPPNQTNSQNPVNSAIAYARQFLSPHSAQHMSDIRYLMGALLYAPRGLQDSPYSDLLDQSHWDRVIDMFKSECCAQEGQPSLSPLYVTLTAGAQALPTLLKLSAVTRGKFASSAGLSVTSSVVMHDESIDAEEQEEEQEESEMEEEEGEAKRSSKKSKQRVGQLGVQLDIDPSFTYHSVFTCPVSKEMADDNDNPPTMLPCGHVLCKNTILKMIRSPHSRFKCPYCPTEATMATCKTIRF